MNQLTIHDDLLGFLTTDCRDLQELSGKISQVSNIMRVCQHSLVNLMLQFESMSLDGIPAELAAEVRADILNKASLASRQLTEHV